MHEAEHTARLARWDALLAQAQGCPSLPDLGREMTRLHALVTTLTARVEALEQECTALRQEALLRLWGDEDG